MLVEALSPRCGPSRESMDQNRLSDSVRRLVTSCINSVAELEATLLLRQDRRDWTADEVAQKLFVSRDMAEGVLATLARIGFFTMQNGRYRYAPPTRELEAAIDELADAYVHQLIALTNFIHSKPPSSIRQFAEAFRIRKDK